MFLQAPPKLLLLAQALPALLHLVHSLQQGDGLPDLLDLVGQEAPVALVLCPQRPDVRGAIRGGQTTGGVATITLRVTVSSAGAPPDPEQARSAHSHRNWSRGAAVPKAAMPCPYSRRAGSVRSAGAIRRGCSGM